ncbi:MAG: hypothetical protein HJJLKODD_01763 [Phycisphaerae bacterium]|nr:hypothetical protein [Phycisphaerae bacterium]
MSRPLRYGICVLLMIAGCTKPTPQPTEVLKPSGKDYNKPLPPGQLALRKIDPADYPDFGRGYYNQARLRDAIRNSLNYMSKPSSQRYFPYGPISHEQAVASLQRFLEVLDQARSPEQLNEIIVSEYDVYQSVGCDDCGTVLFTGYYTPIFDGRQQPDSQYRYPLYALPPDLVKDEDGNILGRRTTEGRTVPYYTRQEIESSTGLFSGLEIAWLKDPFETYVITVQGSAKLRLADGSLYELGYAANNGHEYQSVRELMIQDGLLEPTEASLQTMLAYFQSHPDKIQHYTWQNPRYVFFREAPGGPFGSINEPVLPQRTIATDKSIYPRACLAYLMTTLPQSYQGEYRQLPFASFTLDQDTGGAIRAAGRTDIYMGVGPEAEVVSGRTYAEGQLYYIFLKNYAAAPATAAPTE